MWLILSKIYLTFINFVVFSRVDLFMPFIYFSVVFYRLLSYLTEWLINKILNLLIVRPILIWLFWFMHYNINYCYNMIHSSCNLLWFVFYRIYSSFYVFFVKYMQYFEPSYMHVIFLLLVKLSICDLYTSILLSITINYNNTILICI